MGDAVGNVYENDRFRHVLIMTMTANVFMVVVVRLDADLIKGHYIMELNATQGSGEVVPQESSK